MDLLTRMARKSGAINITKKDTTESALQRAMTFINKKEPRMLDTLEFLIHAEEYYWLKNGKHAYFFDSSATARALIDSSFVINDLGAACENGETFMLCLPDDLTLGNQKVTSGALVVIGKHIDRADFVINSYAKWIDKGKLQCNMDMGEDPEHLGLYICYQEHYGSCEYMRMAMPISNVNKCLSFDSADEYNAYMKKTNAFNYFAGIHLDAPEMSFQFDLVRLVGALLLYKKAMPERLKQGLPFSFKEQHFDSRYIKSHKPVVLHSPAASAQGANMSVHYRSWHFRQLMDKRFYQREHAAKPIGSRIVFVRDSIVNREIEAETVL
jgi:hypothetical protein